MAKLRISAQWCGVLSVFLIVSHVEAPPAAEIVFFTSGRTLLVSGHTVDGSAVVLHLPGGGEVVCDPTLIDRIEPDADTAPPALAPKVAVELVIPPAPPLPSMPYAEFVKRASERHGVDPRLVYALIEVESSYRPHAESPRGAMGLMQLMPSTARRYAVGNPFDPEDNINAGTRHLRTLLDKFGTKGALAAYNAGEGPVRQFDGIPPYPETRKFVSRVLEIVDAQVVIQ